MIEAARHVPLRTGAWDRGAALSAIAEIVEDACARFDEHTFWPGHPQDDEVGDGTTSIYIGAAGVIWALNYLARLGATERRMDFRPVLARLLEKNRAEFAEMPYPQQASLLFGELGVLLLSMRLDPMPATADALHANAMLNTDAPIRALMWGLPGSMLACVVMAEMTGEPRWQAMFERQAERLFGELEETDDGPLWTQDLYGMQRRWLGPVHGYAGNMIPLLRGWHWLDDGQRARVADAVPRTLGANAWRSDLGANWRSVALRDREPNLCQHCHGAAGMVTTFADAPFNASELETLLIDGAELTWHAGPLAKGSNLCHGTSGNGYAFLKMYRRTGDALWLERARAFAVTAMAQCREARAQYGRGRYSLWTGDVGLAVYLWDCVTAEPRFPTIDVF
jgi:hypothetical protein